MALKIGDKAPDFSLISDQNKLVSLKDLRGKKIVLYFYPKDNTPGCTREACDFRDAICDFQSEQIEIIGISKDHPEKHQQFKQKFNLPFTLLADTQGTTCEAYGIFKKKSLFGKSFLGIQRTTFLIDEQGIIQAIWPNVKVTGHIEKILKTLKTPMEKEKS